MLVLDGVIMFVCFEGVARRRGFGAAAVAMEAAAGSGKVCVCGGGIKASLCRVAGGLPGEGRGSGEGHVIVMWSWVGVAVSIYGGHVFFLFSSFRGISLQILSHLLC